MKRTPLPYGLAITKTSFAPGRREAASSYMNTNIANTTTTATHLVWTGRRFVEAVREGDGWRFKSGRDAADWIRG